jgi:hypothetical protein
VLEALYAEEEKQLWCMGGLLIILVPHRSLLVPHIMHTIFLLPLTNHAKLLQSLFFLSEQTTQIKPLSLKSLNFVSFEAEAGTRPVAYTAGLGLVLAHVYFRS